jgi:predicted MPP superfamily phosphohydrolase
MRKKVIQLVLIAAVVFLAYLLVQENNKLEITRFKVADSQLPEGFTGFRIVHLSDLHNKSFGLRQEELVSKVTALEPDIIVFTGDLLDEMEYNKEAGFTFVQRLQKIAPLYFVPGNNDLILQDWQQIRQKIEALGAKVLTEEVLKINRSKESITLIGINDLLSVPNGEDIPRQVIKNKLDEISARRLPGYKILLVHRPQFLDVYSDYRFDLVLAGHTHGGQVRLPKVGGLIAPGQWFFPKYTAGLYEEETTKLIVNRGLGNSIIPQRLFNRPEIGLITLTRD